MNLSNTLSGKKKKHTFRAKVGLRGPLESFGKPRSKGPVTRFLVWRCFLLTYYYCLIIINGLATFFCCLNNTANFFMMMNKVKTKKLLIDIIYEFLSMKHRSNCFILSCRTLGSHNGSEPGSVAYRGRWVNGITPPPKL